MTLLDGLVSHHQSCMNSAVDLSPANGVKHTVSSLPCVHHETSVFSVCCIIKKSHEAVVGHSCSPHSIPSPCSPSSSTRSFFFSCIRFHAAEPNGHSSCTDSQHVGALGLAGCCVIVAQICSVTLGSLYFFMIIVNIDCFFVKVVVWLKCVKKMKLRCIS